MPEQMGWLEAIIKVLQERGEAMHYTEIAEQIVSLGLRSSMGATPANTVNVYMSDSIREEKGDSPFDRTSRGYYRLRAADVTSNTMPALEEHIAQTQPVPENILEEAKDTTGLINALGMYWSRDKVIWTSTTPKMLGRQAVGSDTVDFSGQAGVYLLYDRSTVIYVGRAVDQGIGTRLKQHTFDRLSSRWDRFSWFGVYSVSESGALNEDSQNYDRALLIATMEALLIESVEPSQNRRRGDDFRAVEFLQAEDPEIELIRMRAVLGQMTSRLGLY